MQIRPAEIQDAQKLVTLWNDVIDHSTAIFHSTRRTKEQVIDWINERGPGFLVAHDEGRILAFATYFRFRAGNGYDHTVEYTVITAPNAQRQGAARQVVEALLQNANAQGLHAVMAVVSGENAAGINFHRTLGFTEVGHLPEVGSKFGRWLDAVLFQKLL